MSWQRDGSLHWRRIEEGGAIRLEFRDRTRALLGGGAGGLLVAVLGWAFFARVEQGGAEVPSLMMHGVMTVILAAFALSAALSRTRFALADGWLCVQGRRTVPLNGVAGIEPVQRGAYAGLAVRRTDGVLEALAPVFLSRAKADRIGARLTDAFAAARAAGLIQPVETGGAAGAGSRA